MKNEIIRGQSPEEHDNPSLSKGELIASEDHSLATRKSSLVKRGLDLIQEQKKRRVQILMATGKEPTIEGLWINLLEEKAGEKYDFDFVKAFTANDILKLAQTNKIDIFMLFLNNIPFYSDYPYYNISPDRDGSWGTSQGGALQLVTHLKTTYRRPVVTFSAFSDIDIEEKAKQAGADFYFQAPFGLDNVSEALMICLERLS